MSKPETIHARQYSYQSTRQPMFDNIYNKAQDNNLEKSKAQDNYLAISKTQNNYLALSKAQDDHMVNIKSTR